MCVCNNEPISSKNQVKLMPGKRNCSRGWGRSHQEGSFFSLFLLSSSKLRAFPGHLDFAQNKLFHRHKTEQEFHGVKSIHSIVPVYQKIRVARKVYGGYIKVSRKGGGWWETTAFPPQRFQDRAGQGAGPSSPDWLLPRKAGADDPWGDLQPGVYDPVRPHG